MIQRHIKVVRALLLPLVKEENKGYFHTLNLFILRREREGWGRGIGGWGEREKGSETDRQKDRTRLSFVGSLDNFLLWMLNARMPQSYKRYEGNLVLVKCLPELLFNILLQAVLL